MPLDTVRLNETPEGVDLGLRVAGPVPRALALALDGFIRLGLYIIMIPLTLLAGLGAGLVLLGVFLIGWLYPVFFEVIQGATPGKRAMGLAVVHDDGTPVGLPASLIRNLLRVVDFLPIFYGVGLVSALADADFRRLGDLAAGTLVIHAEPRGPKPPLPAVDPRQPPRGLTLAAQQAILAFAERSGRLSSERRAELAEALLARLDDSGGPRGQAAVERVQGYASWLARGR
jgi:uncharacterized RDD family membrane protein YckC